MAGKSVRNVDPVHLPVSFMPEAASGYSLATISSFKDQLMLSNEQHIGDLPSIDIQAVCLLYILLIATN